MSEATLFHVVFSESDYDPERETPWMKTLFESFPQERQPKFWVSVEMTEEEFQSMTGKDDIVNNIGYVEEHYDGPGVFGVDMALHEIDDLVDAINEADGHAWQLREHDDITPPGWQAMVEVMERTLDLDWDVQSEIVDGDFVDQHRDKIALFMEPASDC